jgi:hypothetical protein
MVSEGERRVSALVSRGARAPSFDGLKRALFLTLFLGLLVIFLLSVPLSV